MRGSSIFFSTIKAFASSIAIVLMHSGGEGGVLAFRNHSKLG